MSKNTQQQELSEAVEKRYQKEELNHIGVHCWGDNFSENEKIEAINHHLRRVKKFMAVELSQAHQSGIEEERKRIGKELSDEMALFLKQWSYEQYGKRYIGIKDQGYLRYEGVLIDLDQRINKVLKGESLKENKQ